MKKWRGTREEEDENPCTNDGSKTESKSESGNTCQEEI